MKRSYIRGPVFTILNFIRNKVVRTVRPLSSYYLFPSSERRSVKPISVLYGYDRGKPVDRYYIESFLEENKKYIKGKCLEITDTQYTKKFGGKKVIFADALDIDRNNPNATIYGDLRELNNIKDNEYDCLIITQTLVVVDNYEAAIRECKRILKPGGALLVTVPCLSPVWNIKIHYWRFTGSSANYIFKKYFHKFEVKTYGNVLSGQAFWVGMSQEELTREELDFNDPYFPVIVAIRAIK